MATEENTHIVFVYGTLKKGYGNHQLLKDAEFIGEAISAEDGFEMVSFGGFPGVLRRPDLNYRIHGELYRLNDRSLMQMDMLEGNGSFYNRNELDFYTLDQPSMVKHTAWVYLLVNHHPDKVGEKSSDVIADRYDGFHQVQKWRRV